MAAFNASIGAGNDDGSIFDGGLLRTETTLRLDNAISPYQDIYLRFNSVTVPKNATISAATVTLIGVSSGNTISATVYMEAHDNAPALSESEAVASRTWTSVGANTWAIPALSAGTSYQSMDFADLMQTIVNRSGWASGNSVLVRLHQSGSGGKGASRVFRAYEHGSSPRLAQLDVTYTTGGTKATASSGVSG